MPAAPVLEKIITAEEFDDMQWWELTKISNKRWIYTIIDDNTYVKNIRLTFLDQHPRWIDIITELGCYWLLDNIYFRTTKELGYTNIRTLADWAPVANDDPDFDHLEDGTVRETYECVLWRVTIWDETKFSVGPTQRWTKTLCHQCLIKRWIIMTPPEMYTDAVREEWSYSRCLFCETGSFKELRTGKDAIQRSRWGMDHLQELHDEIMEGIDFHKSCKPRFVDLLDPDGNVVG